MKTDEELMKILGLLGPETKTRNGNVITYSQTAFLATIVDAVMRDRATYKSTCPAQLVTMLMKEFPPGLEHHIQASPTELVIDD